MKPLVHQIHNTPPCSPSPCRHGRRLAIVTSIIALCTALPALAQQRSDRRSTGDDASASLLEATGETFKIRETAHFLIAYNAEVSTLRDFIARVEATYKSIYRFLEVNKIPHQRPVDRLEMIFVADFDGFHAYAERSGARAAGAAGYYDPRTNRSVFYDATTAPRLAEVNEEIQSLQAQLKSREKTSRAQRKHVVKTLHRLRNERDRTVETINQIVVQHEVAHQVLFNAGVHNARAQNPDWLVEGLACLFETPPSSTGAGVAAVNQYRLINLRIALVDGGDYGSARPDDRFAAFKSGHLLPLREFVAARGLFNTAQAGVEDRYSQAWSLVQYLQRKKRRQLAEYLTELSQRPERREYSTAQELELFETVFGPIDEKFEQRWLTYILDLPYVKIE